MTIKKISENPYRKHSVKKLPADAEYRQQSVTDEEIFYSNEKKAYYVISKSNFHNTNRRTLKWK